jgi:hypothetical protein
MANRLPAGVVLAFSAFFISGLTTAHAADPAFCKQYSQAALNQVRGGLIPAAPAACRARAGRRISRFITNGVLERPSARPASSGMRGRNICDPADRVTGRPAVPLSPRNKVATRI